MKEVPYGVLRAGNALHLSSQTLLAHRSSPLRALELLPYSIQSAPQISLPWHMVFPARRPGNRNGGLASSSVKTKAHSKSQSNLHFPASWHVNLDLILNLTKQFNEKEEQLEKRGTAG